MNWTRETRTKLARRIRILSLEIQDEEFARPGSFPEKVENTIERIMERLEPLGFKRANKDWKSEGHEDLGFNLYQDSPTHLWFETAQARVVTISKEDAHKVLVLGLP